MPLAKIRNLSSPPVSAVIVSAAGNLIAVLVSPVWIILSAIDKSLLAVMIPTESTLVTSSYVKTPPTFTLPVNVAATPVIFPIEPSTVRSPNIVPP